MYSSATHTGPTTIRRLLPPVHGPTSSAGSPTSKTSSACEKDNNTYKVHWIESHEEL